jgi:ketosteroid isomerase-like protein
MSKENVDHVHGCLDAYRRGDYEAASAYLAPDVVWEVDQELPAHGPAAVRNVWSRWDSEWEELDTVADELIDAGDQVVAAIHYRARGRSSGVEVNMRVFEVHTFRDGKCIRKVDFRERSEALTAAGLPE